ncbi:MAG: radical SAM protein [Candidatus Aenigmarchaeota archaeon]|nr:radical SAM protein [Candidatus Aenigmarchaeota archaeon]MDW8149790.1 radical SAM protein [Candidatus Aenigmarchaeota archaeon]
MIIKEINCKTLLNKSKIEDYCINCYIGCSHSCKYCYAEFITRKMTSHKEEWGSFVDVKINAPNILREEIKRKKKGKVFLSSLTDPYQPIEKKYELTRKCLEILLNYNFPIVVQTKSYLVLRDLDLFKKFESCKIGFTITTLDDDIRKIFEPNSSSVEEKIKAIEILKNNGIFVYIFFGPVLPFLSDENLEEYFNKMVELNIDEVLIDKLNLKPGLWNSIRKVLETNYPKLLEEWRKILFLKNNYWDLLKKRIKRICYEKKIKYIFCY